MRLRKPCYSQVVVNLVVVCFMLTTMIMCNKAFTLAKAFCSYLSLNQKIAARFSCQIKGEKKKQDEISHSNL